MPPKKIGKAVVVFDANSSEEFKRQAIDCYKTICERFHFSEDLNRETSRILLTNAHRPDQDSTNFFVSDYALYNPSQCRYVEEAVGMKGNWIRSVELAADNLRELYDIKCCLKYHILVFTDFTTPLDLNDLEISESITNISQTVSSIRGNVYFLGVNLQPERMLRNLRDVRSWMKSLTPEKLTQGLDVAVKIVQECSGVICDFNLGPDLYMSYTKTNPPQSQFTEPLAFGDLIDFKTSVVTVTGTVSALSTRADREIESSKFVLAEDQEVVVEKEEVIDGYLIQDKLIIVPKDVTKGTKEYPRFFKLLGFTDKSNVPPHYYRSSSTNLVRNRPKRDPTSEIVNYVIEAAEKYNKVGIALRAYMKNSRPLLYCLIPKTNPHYFLMVQLPFAQDFRQYYKEQDIDTFVFKEPEADPDKKASDDLKSDVYRYLDSIDLDDKIQLHPHLRMSDSMKRASKMFMQQLEGKTMEEAPLYPFGIEFKTTELPDDLKEKLKSSRAGSSDEIPDLW